MYQNKLLTYSLRFVVLVLLQVLVINQMDGSDYLMPVVYPIFILLLAPTMPKISVLVLAFAIGFSVDICSNTLGLHMSASLLMAFARPYALSWITLRGGDVIQKVGIYRVGFRKFLIYAGILIFIHQFYFYILDAFHFMNFSRLFLKILLNTVVSVGLIFLTLVIFESKKQSRR